MKMSNLVVKLIHAACIKILEDILEEDKRLV